VLHQLVNQPLAQPLVIGHRGLRANTTTDEAVRENTLHALHSGHQAGATWAEFDVQVTADDVPVLWHDDTLDTAAEDGRRWRRAVRQLSLEEFRRLASGRRVTHDGVEQQLTRRFKDPQGGGDATPWTCSGSGGGEPTTLQEALQGAPSALRFDIELKFQSHRPSTPEERGALLQSTLQVMEQHAGDRLIFFSSFDPDACVELRQLQDQWPVLMLTCMHKESGDPRQRSLQAAVEVAIRSNLDGVVANNGFLFEEVEQIHRLKSAGLSLLTYGDGNIDPEMIVKQLAAGVDGLCTDNISLCNATAVTTKLLESAIPSLRESILPKRTPDLEEVIRNDMRIISASG